MDEAIDQDFSKKISARQPPGEEQGKWEAKPNAPKCYSKAQFNRVPFIWGERKHVLSWDKAVNFKNFHSLFIRQKIVKA